MPKISIIIPVYNAQEYLERCLDSVCNQTLKDIEIICVNDCSKDNSLQILQDYSKKYPNLKIIDCKVNGGESAARNKGLEIATGEYLAFVDNDDTIDLDFYEKLYSLAKDKNLDIAKGDCYEIEPDKTLLKGDDNEILDKNNHEKLFFRTHWWTAIYKRTLVAENNIRFREDIILGGDIIFLNQMLLAAKTFDYIYGTYYYHYQRENSGDSAFLSIEKIKSTINSYKTIIDNLTKNYNHVTADGYAGAVCYYLGGIFSRYTKNNSLEAIQLCVDSTFEQYAKINKTEEFKQEMLESFPYITIFLENNNKQELVEFIKNNSTVPQQVLLIRYKLKLNRRKNIESSTTSNQSII